MAKKKSAREKLEEDCQAVANFKDAPVYLVGAGRQKHVKNMSIVTAESYFPQEGVAIYFAAWPKKESA